MNNYKLQSILFPKNKFTYEQATQFLSNHKFKNKGVDEKENFYRFRQLSTDYLKRLGYTNYKTKVLNNGIELIIAYND